MLILIDTDDSPRRYIVETDIPVRIGDVCIVEIDEMPRYCTVENIIARSTRHLPSCAAGCKFVRTATDADVSRRDTNARLAASAIKAFDTENAGAPQKPYAITAYFSVDRTKLVLLYHADHPFDARRSEASLHRRFGAEVTARQIGIRDEVAAIGSIGPCGRPVCCAHWLKSASSLNINVRMAKKQNLSLNPTNLNGHCEKLKCCLGFEMDEK